MPNPCPELRKKSPSGRGGKKEKKESKRKDVDKSKGTSKSQAEAPAKPNIQQSPLDKALPAYPPTTSLSEQVTAAAPPLTSEAILKPTTPPENEPDQLPMTDEVTINTLVKGARKIEKRMKDCEKEKPPDVDMLRQLFLAWTAHKDSMKRIEELRRSSNKPLNAGERRSMEFIYGLKETAERVHNLVQGRS